jgi:hypothetical protein
LSATTWERLAGDTSAFALKLAFETNPDPEDRATPDEAASWGSFQVWVDGQNLCAHMEQGETLESAHWYLLPMLEWLVDRWDPLLHEERVPVADVATAAGAARDGWFPGARTDWSPWWQRHSLQACRDGGLFPNLYIRRWRDLIEFSWDSARLPGVPRGFHFLASQGEGRVPVEAVAQPLHRVVGDAITELSSRLPDSLRLAHLVRQHERLHAAEREGPEYRDRFSWLSGFGAPSARFRAVWDRLQSSLQSMAPGARDEALRGDGQGLAITGTPHAAVLFGCLAPTIADEDVIAVTDILLGSYSPHPRPEGPLDDLRRSLDLPTALPWQEGNVLADEVIDALGLRPDPGVDVAAVLERLGVSQDAVSLTDPNVRAISIAGPYHVPTVFLNVKYPDGTSEWVRRFSLAHELCHLLLDCDRGRRITVASGPWAPLDIEQRANAFAAALLVPEATLDEEVARAEERAPLPSAEAIQVLSRRHSVSRLAMIDRLHNLGYLERSERDRLRGWALAIAGQGSTEGREAP